MNKARRKTLERIVSNLMNLREEIESVKDEEEFAFDAMPDSLQESERGDAMQEAIEALDEALSSLDDVIDSVNEAIDA